MIKLQRPSKPSCLTPELVQTKTEEFKANGTSVWHIEELKEALLDMSDGKCCYCECNITEESKYMEVEHFKCKDKYKNEVLEWLNLLPSCKRCNGIKHNHDVLIEPIIDPSTTNPKEHLKYYHLTLYAKDELGQSTIDVLNLNDSSRLVTPRFELWLTLNDTLKNLELIADGYIEKPITRRKNRLVNSFKLLLMEATPSSEYAAVYATILLNEPAYKKISSILKDKELWNEELEALEQAAQHCQLDLKPPQ